MHVMPKVSVLPSVESGAMVAQHNITSPSHVHLNLGKVMIS